MVNALIARLGVDSKGFTTGLNKAQGTLKDFAAKAGVAFGVGGILAFSRSIINLGSQISDLADNVNTGVESFQALSQVAQDTGANQQILANALRQVQVSAGEAAKGSATYVDAFNKLNINVQEFKKSSPDKMLEMIAKSQLNATNKLDAYNAGITLLGAKNAPKLNEALRKLGSEGLEGITQEMSKAGRIIDKDAIAKLDELSDRIEALKTEMQARFAPVLLRVVEVFENFAPVLVPLSKGLIAVVAGMTALKAVTIVGNASLAAYRLTTTGLALAKGALATSTFVATGAMKSFSLALKSTGIGAVVSAVALGVGLLAEKLIVMASGMDDASEENDEYLANIKETSIQISNTTKATSDLNENLKVQKMRIEGINQRLIDYAKNWKESRGQVWSFKEALAALDTELEKYNEEKQFDLIPKDSPKRVDEVRDKIAKVEEQIKKAQKFSVFGKEFDVADKIEDPFTRAEQEKAQQKVLDLAKERLELIKQLGDEERSLQEELAAKQKEADQQAHDARMEQINKEKQARLDEIDAIFAKEKEKIQTGEFSAADRKTIRTREFGDAFRAQGQEGETREDFARRKKLELLETQASEARLQAQGITSATGSTPATSAGQAAATPATMNEAQAEQAEKQNEMLTELQSINEILNQLKTGLSG